MIEIHKNEIPGNIKDAEKVILYFWGENCSFCKKMKPELEKLDKQMGEKVEILKINVDENEKIAEEYNVRSLPSTIILINGEKKEKLLGFKSSGQLKGKVS